MRRVSGAPAVALHSRVGRVGLTLSALIVAGAASAALASPASAALDANCPGPSTTAIGIGPGDGRIAQTFTAQATGRLTMGQIEVNLAEGPGDYLMRVYATDGLGAPTNAVLAETNVPDESVPADTSTATGVFATPAEVISGQQYALAISRPGAMSVNVGARLGDPCPGTVYNSFSPAGMWNETGFDMVFAVFVEPDCDSDGFGDETQDPSTPSCHPRTLVLDANKNKVKKGKKVTLAGQVVETRQDGACAAGQAVELQRKKPSLATFTTIEQLQTDAAGAFSAKKKVKKTFEYRAQVPESATCAGQTSNTEKVKVKKK
jgi:hypothetical protein